MLTRKLIRHDKGKFKEKWSLSRLLLDSLFHSISQRIKLKRKYILKVFYLASFKPPLRSSSSMTMVQTGRLCCWNEDGTGSLKQIHVFHFPYNLTNAEILGIR